MNHNQSSKASVLKLNKASGINGKHNRLSSNEPAFRLRDMFKTSFDLWIIAWVLGLITAISMIALLMISGWFITAAALAGLIAVGSHTFNYMVPAGIIRILAMARTAGRYGELMVSHNAVFDLLKSLRLKFFNRLSVLPLAKQRHTLHASQYMHRLVSDIDKLDEFIISVVSPWLIGTVTTILLSIFICWVLPVSFMTKLILNSLLLLTLILPFVASVFGIQQAERLSQLSEARRKNLLAPLAVITQLLLWQQWQSQTKDYINSDTELQQLEWQAQKQRSIYMLGIQWLHYGCILIVLFAIIQLVDSVTIETSQQLISVPLILAVTLGLLGIQEVIIPLGQHYLAFGNSVAAKNRLNDLLQQETQLNKSKNIDFSNSKTMNSEPLALPTGRITAKLHEVSAKIPNALVGVQNVTIEVQSGIPLIINGPSGCGKSTLLQALAAELPLMSGDVSLNNNNWFDYDWQDKLGYLGQHLDIFDQSLAANLRLGKPEATDSELLSVLDKVDLLEWLKQQPQGLNTPLGEYGAAISGGQARRIALARLLLKPRRVLLLDEPFAGLDAVTREKVWQSVREHQQNDLLIVVSHQQWNMGVHDTLALSEGIFVA